VPLCRTREKPEFADRKTGPNPDKLIELQESKKIIFYLQEALYSITREVALSLEWESLDIFSITR